MTGWIKRRISFTALVAGVLAAAILHICWTLAIPSLALETPHTRLIGNNAPNRLHILPVAKPGSQPVPFVAPDVRLAICPFDIPRGSLLEIAVQLPEPGWTMSLLDADGGVFYSVAGQRGRRTDLKLTLAPPADRLFGIWPQGKGQSLDPNQLQAPVSIGLLVLTAPVKGAAFGPAIEAQLRAASCSLRAN